MIGAWWQSLAPRERQMLGIGAAVVALLLAWSFVWHPLNQKRAQLRQQVDSARADLAYVLVATAQVAQLRVAGAQSRGDRAGRSLLAVADASARSAGLEAALKRVEPVGSRTVRVSFEFARFDALVNWLETLHRDYGIQASNFSADRADGVGLVNARVTLDEAS